MICQGNQILTITNFKTLHSDNSDTKCTFVFFVPGEILSLELNIQHIVTF